jgi:hypothetical protein
VTKRANSRLIRTYCVFVTLCLAFFEIDAFGQTADGFSRVRAGDPTLRQLLDEGIDRSVTFRGLVRRIDRTDGIVYVQSGSCSISAAKACLMLSVHPAGHNRYLSIHVRPGRRQADTQIAFIGHELQHANELLAARWVRTSADAYALFIRIGSAESIRSFETADAVRVGSVVAEELAARPRPGAAVMHATR